MKFNKKLKKGFTLVELIVVIAIVAILAAVSVVSYIAFINSANESADLQLVKQINLCMEASEVLHGKNQNMQEALDTAFDNGFVIENLTPRSNKDIVWNSESNRFELLDHAPASHPEIMFKIYNSVAEMLAGQTSEGYSAYLNSKEPVNEVLTVHTGFDAGENQTIQEMRYINDGEKQTVIFRTNSGDLLVDGSEDTVKHYGVGRYLTIDAVGPTDCYHEFGVFGEIDIHDGKLVIQSSGFVGSVTAVGTNDNVAIENNGTIMDATGASQIDITGSGNLESDVIQVGSFEQFQGLAYACNQGTTFEGYTLKLMADIDMTGKVWVPFGIYAEGDPVTVPDEGTYYMPKIKLLRLFKGNIDGNGHKIINLSNRGYETEYTHRSISGSNGAHYGLIAIGTGNIKISNLEISFDIVQEGEQALNCVGIIGQYYGLDTTPIARHNVTKTQDADVLSEQVWQNETVYNSRYNSTSHRYDLINTTVEFNNVKTSGTIKAGDAASAYVGTTYVTNQMYNFDDNSVLKYSNTKNTLSGTGIQVAKTIFGESYGNDLTKQTIHINRMYELATDGYYYECFTNADFAPYINGEAKTFGNKVGTTFAPLQVSYKFVNCENGADVYSDNRAAVFMGKCTHSITINDLLEITFQGTINSGKVFTKTTNAGIFTGNYGSSVICGSYSAGLENTSRACVTTGYGTSDEHVYDGENLKLIP